ncbi:hypothetical protein HHI36_001020 [Cryptolaemus montrouzieri]|uniref:Uncharacterized protein n=1 Tax=Cryptolaemus montrouzieri TaxID=559131 RepID=A0ABD2P6K4_9CUCU
MLTYNDTHYRSEYFHLSNYSYLLYQECNNDLDNCQKQLENENQVHEKCITKMYQAVEMINASQKEKSNLEIQIENLQTAEENLIEEIKTSKMKMNACQNELKEEKSIMKELDTNIDSCIQREEECLDKRRRFSTELNKCRSDKRRIKINCRDNLKLNQTMHEM